MDILGSKILKTVEEIDSMRLDVILGPEMEYLLDATHDVNLAMELAFPKAPTSNVERQIRAITRSKCRNYLQDQYLKHIQQNGVNVMSTSRMAKGQGKMEVNEHGGKRESNKGRGRFDLLPYEGLEELAIWYEDGAEKYGDRNWEKGLSVKDCVNRMVRHSLKAANGFMDEGPFAHLAAVAWNAIAAITMIKRHPEDNDLFPARYKKAFTSTSIYSEDEGVIPIPKSADWKMDHNDKVIVLNLVFKNEDTYRAALTALSQNIPNADFIIQLPQTDEKK